MGGGYVSKLSGTRRFVLLARGEPQQVMLKYRQGRLGYPCFVNKPRHCHALAAFACLLLYVVLVLDALFFMAQMLRNMVVVLVAPMIFVCSGSGHCARCGLLVLLVLRIAELHATLVLDRSSGLCCR